MSGELQTIPARHGVATFVPRGRTIKIINTYGKQVVSTWAFSLGAPPEEGADSEDEVDVEDLEEQVGELKKGLKEEKEEGKGGQVKEEKEEEKPKKEIETNIKEEIEKPKEDATKEVEGTKEEEKKDAEQPKDEEKKDDSQTTQEEAKNDDDDPPEQAPETPENEKADNTKSQSQKRTWASYLPSIPYRSKNTGSNTTNAPSKPDSADEKAQAAATSKKWSSYLPTGKGFSSYVPNVELPDSQKVMSAFQTSHYRDPNKSYAEQLYDFSKTPVGAGAIAAGTGSGTASSLYAAYSAYTKMNPSKNDIPPMEYLSLPHTRAATNRLVPAVEDTLLTNLRNPIITLIEDTSPGAHDTLTTACDASLYAALGVSQPAEHGSCAENLVLALKELNEKAGLKGTKAVGADITVNITPTPLHLFMNTPIKIDEEAKDAGVGAKGTTFIIEEPQGKKRSYVRFRAERDVVIVLSACPMDVGKQNGGKCMAANFMVEEASDEDMGASTNSLKKTPKKTASNDKDKESKKSPEEKEKKPTVMPRPRGGPAKIKAVKKSANDAANVRRDSKHADVESDNPPESELPDEVKKEHEKAQESKKADLEQVKKDVGASPTTPKSEEDKSSSTDAKKEDVGETASQTQGKDSPPAPASAAPAASDAPKPKKKPKKLERRGGGTPAKSEKSEKSEAS